MPDALEDVRASGLVANDVAFHSNHVEAVLHSQVRQAATLGAALQKRLFAVQAEYQQLADAARVTQAVLSEAQKVEQQTPRSDAPPSPRLQTRFSGPSSARQASDLPSTGSQPLGVGTPHTGRSAPLTPRPPRVSAAGSASSSALSSNAVSTSSSARRTNEGFRAAPSASAAVTATSLPLPSLLPRPTSNRRRPSEGTRNAELANAIGEASDASEELQHFLDQLRTLRDTLSAMVRWIQDLSNRDGECISSLPSRKQRARAYRHNGGIQLSSVLSMENWQQQANAAYVDAGEVLRRSVAAKEAASNVCRRTQIVTVRWRKATLDAIAESVSNRLEQKHGLQCELNRVAKRTEDATKALRATEQRLADMKTPLKVALVRQEARQGANDAVGQALAAEKDAVVRGYRQLRCMKKRLASDLDGLKGTETELKRSIAAVDGDIGADRTAILGGEENLAVTLAPRPPQRNVLRTFHRGEKEPNPISWTDATTAESMLKPEPVKTSLWNNLRAQQYPGQRRDPKGPRKAPRRRSLQPSGGGSRTPRNTTTATHK